MQIRRKTMFGSPRSQKVIADSKYYGVMVSSDPDAIGGLWFIVNGQGTENGKVYQIRLAPDEIEAAWALYCEKGAGTDWKRVLADLLEELAHEEGSWYTQDEGRLKLLEQAHAAYYSDKGVEK